MIEIQATEAAKRFGHLIERVMAGEKVRIIRQGRHVADVTRAVHDRDDDRLALQLDVESEGSLG